MVEVSNEHFAKLKLNKLSLMFKDPQEEDYYLQSDDNANLSIVFLLYFISIVLFWGPNVLINYFFNKSIISQQLLTKSFAAFDAVSSLIFIFISWKRFVLNSVLQIYFFITIIFKVSAIYVDKEDNDTIVCFSFFFLFSFPLLFLNKCFKHITIGIIIYSIAILPGLFFKLMPSEIGMLNKTSLLSSLPMIYNLCMIFIGIITNILINCYFHEFDSRIQYSLLQKCIHEVKKDNDVLSNLTPEFVRKKMSTTPHPFFDYENVSIVFCDISDFDKIVQVMSPKDLILLLDNIYNVFDYYCLIHGIQKIETVGKTYMAAGGIKECEEQFEEDILNKHHAIRIFELAIDMIETIRKITLENLDGIRVKIGIHIGKVIPAVVGSRKPQFSLIGDAVNTTARMCSYSLDNCINCSESAYSEISKIYDTPDDFELLVKEIKGKGSMNTYLHMPFKDFIFDNYFITYASGTTPKNTSSSPNKIIKPSLTPKTDLNSSLIFKRTNTFKRMLSNEEKGLCSQSTDTNNEIKKLSKSLKLSGYNENKKDNKKAKTINTLFKNSYLFCCFKNKIHSEHFRKFQHAKLSKASNQSIIVNALFLIFSLLFFYNLSQLSHFMSNLECYFISGNILLLISLIPSLFHTAYLIRFHPNRISHFNVIVYSLLSISNNIQLNVFHEEILITLIVYQLMIIISCNYNGLLSYYQTMAYFIINICFSSGNIVYNREKYYYIKYNTIVITYCFIGVAFKIIGLYSFTYKYELVQKENKNLALDEERLFKLMPPHVIQNLKDANPVADILYKVTLLYADIVKFTDYSAGREPVEIVQMLTELFNNFDRATETCNVYKVHTIGDCYVVMSFTGEVPLNERNYVDEAKNVIHMGEEMIRIIRQVREMFHDNQIDMRIGIHTGTVIAGIIGTQVVRYDIFGSDVLLANKMESAGMQGKINISENTKLLLQGEENANGLLPYYFVFNKVVEIPAINKEINSYYVEIEEI